MIRRNDSATQEDEYVNCTLCGQDDTTVFVRGSGKMQIVRCRKDGLVYVNPRPSGRRIKEVSENFVRSDNRHLFDVQRKAALRREADAIQVLKNGGNLLDIGCATGSFFEAFSGRSWRFFGVEPSQEAAHYAAERYSADVFAGNLTQAPWKASSFDVVTILDALYYFPDPISELKRVHRLLKEDGILALEIPGYSYKLFRERGPICWVLDRRWSRMRPESMHLYHYSPRTLKLLLQQAGFQIVKRQAEQSPEGRSKLADAVNNCYFRLSSLVTNITGGRLSIAAKEFYICRKL